mmetsp:Transcript_43652/g.87368  ORF Transcript_43652/g.87368 Transcript_43652/m.87368 type:complete len:205 (+) Transcript_43652:726-1340(+)
MVGTGTGTGVCTWMSCVNCTSTHMLVPAPLCSMPCLSWKLMPRPPKRRDESSSISRTRRCTSLIRRLMAYTISGKLTKITPNSRPMDSRRSVTGYSHGFVRSHGSIAESRQMVRMSITRKGSSRDMKPKPESGCRAVLMPAMMPWYSASASRVTSWRGIGPGVMEKRDWPLVRRGSTQSEAVDAGSAVELLPLKADPMISNLVF